MNGVTISPLFQQLSEVEFREDAGSWVDGLMPLHNFTLVLGKTYLVWEGDIEAKASALESPVKYLFVFLGIADCRHPHKTLYGG